MAQQTTIPYDLREHITQTLDDLDAGFDDAPDYASGVCHTLRALGLFTHDEIDRWSWTPIPLARRDMLITALTRI